MPFALRLACLLCLVPLMAAAQDTRATFDLRLLGLKLGEMQLAGFSDSELRRQTVFPFAITYASAGDRMQAVHLKMRTAYGQVTLARRQGPR